MSIASQTSRFTISLERYSSTKGSSGQAKKTWSTANRTSDGLSTSVTADMQYLTAEEVAEYGINNDDVSWRMYTASDPQLGAQDRIVWTDNTSIQRTCRIVSPSSDMAGRGRLWKTIVQEKKNWS